MFNLRVFRPRAYQFFLAVLLSVALLAGMSPTGVMAAGSAAETQAVSHSQGFWYTVRASDTLFSIAWRYGTTVAAIARANNIANPNRIFAGQRLWIPTTVQHCTTYYTIRSSDTLLSIARHFGVNVWDLARANNIFNLNRIFPGQRLCIPAVTAPPPARGFWYTVRPSDTLFSIARRYGTTVAAIVHANNIANPNFIRVGQRLWIP